MMKVLLAADFYYEWTLYETEDLEAFKAWIPKMLSGDDAEGFGYTTLATQDDSTLSDALEEADLVLWISDFEEEMD